MNRKTFIEKQDYWCQYSLFLNTFTVLMFFRRLCFVIMISFYSFCVYCHYNHFKNNISCRNNLRMNLLQDLIDFIFLSNVFSISENLNSKIFFKKFGKFIKWFKNWWKSGWYRCSCSRKCAANQEEKTIFAQFHTIRFSAQKIQ
jgi:hypothetical protein